MPTKIVLVDDHVLLRKGLADLVGNQGYSVLFEAGNGKEFCEKSRKKIYPTWYYWI